MTTGCASRLPQSTTSRFETIAALRARFWRNDDILLWLKKHGVNSNWDMVHAHIVVTLWLMLEQYVQAAYFERVLHRANLRLRDMTQGRYEMYRRKTAENNRSQSGLDIDVMDYYTGKRRSVKTLSGGESLSGSPSFR